MQLTKIKIFEHKAGEPIKVVVGFSNQILTNYVRQKLDRQHLGDTRINIRAIFSQSGSAEDIDDLVKDDYDDMNLRARSLSLQSGR